MTPARHARVAALFAEARRLDAAARPALLGARCGDDLALRREVEALLAHDAAPRFNLDAPAIAQLGSSGLLPGLAGERPEADAPQIAGFSLGERLGAGGMGVVYYATQLQPRRDVALKLIRPGMPELRVLQRFNHEADLLARLEHPSIARLYAFGVADPHSRPQPYFAMEYVPGENLGRYLRSRSLPRDAVLTLFVRICAAVHYAHSRGVLHRDLKPGNILVTPEGVPKILDFGIGKLLDGESERAARATLTGQVLGTPAYMAPEQAAGAADLDTRCDVYALGVLLFEMLSGALPHDVRDKPLAAALRTIAESEPATLRAVGCTAPRDLEIIVGKALRRDPQQRYASAAALGDDVARFQRREPIEARPATLGYQLGRMAARHRGVFIAAGVAMAALVIGAVGLGWGLVDAVRARGLAEKRLVRAESAEALAAERLGEAKSAQAEAERQERIASAVNAFFNEDLLRQLDPQVGRHDITLREAIDAARLRLADRFADEPLVRASILCTLGDAYVTLAEYDEAEALLTEGLALRRAGLPPLHDDVMAAESALVLVYSNRGDVDRAIAMNEEMLAARLAAFGPESPESLAMMNNLAMLQMDRGDLPAALELSETVCETMRRVAPDNVETLATMINLALLYKRVDRLADAGTLLADCDAFGTRVLPERHPYLAYIWNHLGTLYLRQERPAAAIPEFERALALRTELYGDAHPNTLNVQTNLAAALAALGRYDEAEARFLPAIEQRLADAGPRHATMLTDQHNLARCYRDAGRTAEGRALAERVLEIRREDLGDRHQDTLLSASLLGGLLRDAGNREAALPLLTETHTAQREVLGPQHQETLATAVELCACLLDAQAWAEARDLAADSLAALTADPAHAGLRVALLGASGRALCALGDEPAASAALTEAAAVCASRADPPRACRELPSACPAP